jgi:ABC-2 type transport system ATP-binding protein
MSRQDRQARSRELLELVGLWERRDELIVDWGRGLRQRLAIARSLMHRPALLLLDDPDVELNSGSADGNPDFLRNLVSQTGLTILLATNIFSISESMCQCLTVLNRGRVIAQGRTEHVSCLGAVPTIVIDGHGFSDAVCELLLRRPEVAALRHVDNGVAVQLVGRVDTAPLISLLIESGVSVAEVRKVEPTLQSAVESLLLRDTELESISPEKSP